MPQVCHKHCPSESGGLVAVLVILAVVVVAAVGDRVVHAAELIAEIVVICAASIVGLVLIAAMAYAAIRVHRWRANRTRAISAPVRATAAVQSRTAPRAAIEAPKQRLADDQFGLAQTEFERR